jgi:Cu/Ag efflux pump CusA
MVPLGWGHELGVFPLERTDALNVIAGVKKKLAEISGSLPPGVEVVSGYDRSGLIQASIDTLERDLIEEALIVSLVIITFLFHFRSALIAEEIRNRQPSVNNPEIKADRQSGTSLFPV